MFIEYYNAEIEYRQQQNRYLSHPEKIETTSGSRVKTPYVLIGLGWMVAIAIALVTVFIINVQPAVANEALTDNSACFDGQVAYITGEYADALAALDLCFAGNPDDLQYRGMRSTIQFNLGNLEASYEDYLYVLQHSDDEQLIAYLDPVATGLDMDDLQTYAGCLPLPESYYSQGNPVGCYTDNDNNKVIIVEP